MQWQCLLHPLESDINNVVLHVIASCIVHNICQEGNAEYLQEWDNRDSEDVDYPSACDPAGTSHGEHVETAEQIRQILTEHFAHHQ